MTLRYIRPDHDLLLAKAGTLTEALLWIGQFVGKTIVIKYGDNAMVDDDLKRAFAEDAVFLRRVGLRPVTVYGGGLQINSMLERLGITSELRGGLKVTMPEAMDVVRMMLVGQVGRELVGPVNTHLPFAVGMSGEDGGPLRARRCGLVEGGEEINLGLVGDVGSVDPSTLFDPTEAGHIPVAATAAPGPNSQICDVNADTAVSALVLTLGAKRLVVLTDVAGLYANYSDESTIIFSITPEEVCQLMPGPISGMIPKMGACMRAVEDGVRSVTIIDGRVPYRLLSEIFTDDGVGTMACEEPV